MTDRLFMLAPTVCFAARVNMPGTITYPLDEITFDSVTTGAYGDIFPGMTMLLGTSAGADDLGRQRIRKTATSTVLRVGRSSQGTRDGELDVQDNAYITVLWDFRVWAKIPYIDNGVIYKDSDIAAAGNAPYPPPKANGGPGFCATIDPNTEVITVEFDASNSFDFGLSVGPLGGVASYLWEVTDGTIISGTVTDANITVTFPAGFRWVLLTVVADNGKNHQCYIPVYARDPENDDSIENFQIVNHRITPSGQEISLRILEDIPRSTYPDGTLVMIWDKEPTQPDQRNHMLFIGWEQQLDNSVRVERTGTLRDSVLHCVDVAGRLKTLPGFSQVMQAGIPSKWNYTAFPNVFYYLHHLLYWHSTALDVADLLLGSQTLNNFEFKILGSDAATLYDQVNSLANNVTPDHHLTCTRRGQLLLAVDPIIQHVEDRTSTIHDTLNVDDWSAIEWSYQRPPRVYKLLSYAVQSADDGVTEMAALAPGEGEGQGANYIETSERIAYSQFDLNNTEGNRYARLNARQGPYTITLPYSRLSANFDPAYLGWVQLYINTNQAPPRGDTLSGARGVVQEMTITREYSEKGIAITATLVWERETWGGPAITYTPPGAEA